MNPQLLMAEDFTYKLFIMSGLGDFLSIFNKTRNFGGGGRVPDSKGEGNRWSSRSPVAN
jgi:hypothetical protein